ncbi:DUF456 domain-containing protein [Streptomyces sp. NPDC059740]|uniref:DUF456 domain-containing protein n=1 Tax=Streptomyces sp. NPDC059740 TaxID=3346926 RepID=UPI003656265E
MGVWQLFAVGLVLALGLVGVLVRGVPGPLLVWAGVAWWALVEQDRPAWTVLAGACVVLVVGQVLRWLLPGRDPRQAGVPRRLLVRTAVGAVVAGLLLPVLGVFAGAVGTLLVLERVRLGGFGAAWASTRTVMRAVGASVLVELASCLVVCEGWLVAVVWE